MRVPAFVNSELLDPSVRGKASNALMHAVDWYPTLIKLAGGSLTQRLPIDGQDMWPTIAMVLFFSSSLFFLSFACFYSFQKLISFFSLGCSITPYRNVT